MKCPKGKGLNPRHKCRCAKVEEIVPVSFRRKRDSMGQCADGWYFSVETENCVSYDWCPKWDYCGDGRSWDTEACTCVASAQLTRVRDRFKDEIKEELDE